MNMRTTWLSIRLIVVGMVLTFGWVIYQDFQIAHKVDHANLLLANRQPETAENEFLAITHAEPWRKLNWTRLSEQYLLQGKIDKSIQILENLLDRQMLDSGGWSMLARAYGRINQNDKVESALLEGYRTAGSDPERVSTLQNLVAFYRSENEFDKALSYQQVVSDIQPNSVESKINELLLVTVINPGQGFNESNKFKQKPGWLDKWQSELAIALSSSQQDLMWVEIGRAYAGAGIWDLAEYSFNRAVELTPDYGEAWGLLAETRQQQGKDGRTQIEKALSLAPDSPGIRLEGALYYRRQKDFNKAITLLEKNIASQPDELLWQTELARTYADSGQLENAVETFGQAITRNPKDEGVLIDLAQMCVQYNYRVDDLGLPATQRAIELKPELAEAYDVQGEVYFTLGEITNARAAYATVQNLDPEYVPVWLHIGQMALAEGDTTQAKDSLIKAVKLGANSQEGKMARRLLKQYFNIVSND
jgi:tetratricopeptide (TPR) repeat protein